MKSPRSKPKPIQERVENKKKQSIGLSKYSYFLVMVALVLDSVAVQTRDPTFLLLGGLLIMFAWWMAMSTVAKMRKLLDV